MEEYLHSRKPLIIREKFASREPPGFDEGRDKLSQYLENQAPTILREESNGLSAMDGVVEFFSEDIIIPPLNTDIRFSEHLPLHKPTQDEAEGHSHTHPHAIVKESFEEMIGAVDGEGKYLIIPPLNTDIRFSKELPLLNPRSYANAFGAGDFTAYDPRQHEHPGKKHPHELHTHEHTHDNFSWAVPTSHDSPLDLVKKSLIHKVSTQHACGSCWEM
mgnify:CR=1 FL=1